VQPSARGETLITQMPGNGKPESPDVLRVPRFVESRDESAFRSLYGAHTQAMLAVALRWMRGARSDAEDVVQEAWLRAAAGLAGFRWESSLRTWLCGVVINCARNRIREGSSQAVDAATATEPASWGTTGDPHTDLERALARLPDGYREVLNLHDVLGYTHDEIGALLGIDPGTSKSQLSRARSALRGRLGEKGANRDER
jgi:RNA polymerase sigma-70 factor (ECF subfamily)